MTVRRGSTRVVVLIGPLAIKLPRLHFCGGCYPSCASWFFGGMHANSIEAGRWKRRTDSDAAKLCPVVFGCGLLVVMRRCAAVDEIPAAALEEFDGIVNPRDRVACNFGRMSDGRLVAIDYAFW